MYTLFYSHISRDLHNRFISETLTQFPLNFQSKINRFFRWQDAQLSLVGRLLLYNGLRKFNINCKEEELKYTEYNKPYFQNIDINFNISHSGDIVACLFSNERIGIDVELLKTIDINDFKSQMTTKEWKRICDSNNSENEFYKYWTEKEAVIKALGNGLSIPLNSFEVNDLKTSVNQKYFHLKEVFLEESYMCHIASNQPVLDNEIKIVKISPSDLKYVN